MINSDNGSKEEETPWGKILGFLGKFLFAAAVGFGGLVVLGAGLFYINTRPVDLSLSSAGDYIRLEPGDTVLKARTGQRWLDSQRYFLVQADPATFAERITRGGGQEGYSVLSGSGRDLVKTVDKVPEWWDVADLREVVAVNTGSSGSPHNGEYRIYSKERGLIYIIDR